MEEEKAVENDEAGKVKEDGGEKKGEENGRGGVNKKVKIGDKGERKSQRRSLTDLVKLRGKFFGRRTQLILKLQSFLD